MSPLQDNAMGSKPGCSQCNRAFLLVETIALALLPTIAQLCSKHPANKLCMLHTVSVGQIVSGLLPYQASILLCHITIAQADYILTWAAAYGISIAAMKQETEVTVYAVCRSRWSANLNMPLLLSIARTGLLLPTAASVWK